jgi:hypothetical protein
MTPHSLRMGVGPTRQQSRSAQRGWANSNVSHHAHDSDESTRPSIFGGVTPINQRRGTTQQVGCKSAKELLSLAFFSHILSYHFCSHENLITYMELGRTLSRKVSTDASLQTNTQ